VDLLAHGAIGAGPDRDVPTDLTPYRAALAEIDATTGSEVLVAELDGAVVGVCQLTTFRHLQAEGGRCAEIESVHVHPAHRSRGIGGVLLEEAVDRAKSAGCYRVQLTSNNARTDAHRFYECHGFVASHQGFKRAL
jgi:GNAT superfamily N-acetyltransferase